MFRLLSLKQPTAVRHSSASFQYRLAQLLNQLAQLGDAMIRLANYLAGYGYVVAAPEIFHRI